MNNRTGKNGPCSKTGGAMLTKIMLGRSSAESKSSIGYTSALYRLNIYSIPWLEEVKSAVKLLADNSGQFRVHQVIAGHLARRPSFTECFTRAFVWHAVSNKFHQARIFRKWLEPRYCWTLRYIWPPHLWLTCPSLLSSDMFWSHVVTCVSASGRWECLPRRWFCNSILN